MAEQIEGEEPAEHSASSLMATSGVSIEGLGRMLTYGLGITVVLCAGDMEWCRVDGEVVKPSKLVGGIHGCGGTCSCVLRFQGLDISVLILRLWLAHVPRFDR